MAFAGGFFGLLFGGPLGGLVVGGTTAPVGRAAGALNDIGIDDDFMTELGYTLETGTSALFILVIRATADRMPEGLKQFKGTVL